MTAMVSCCSPAASHILPPSADHRGHRGVDDDVARHVQVGDALVGVDHRERAGRRRGRRRCRPRSRPLVVGQRGERRRGRRRGRCWRSTPAAASVVAVLGEDVGEEGLDRVAEDDRVGDLHHRGLEVEREQHALGLGVGDLLGEERVERGDAHERGVDDLAGEDREAVLEHGDGAVGGRRSSMRQRCRRPATVTDFSLEQKSPLAHRGDVGLASRATTRPSSAGGLRA